MFRWHLSIDVFVNVYHFLFFFIHFFLFFSLLILLTQITSWHMMSLLYSYYYPAHTPPTSTSTGTNSNVVMVVPQHPPNPYFTPPSASIAVRILQFYTSHVHLNKKKEKSNATTGLNLLYYLCINLILFVVTSISRIEEKIKMQKVDLNY